MFKQTHLASFTKGFNIIALEAEQGRVQSRTPSGAFKRCGDEETKTYENV